jgi:hypothetical protein
MPPSARVHLDEQGSSEIHAELERILASESFCNSRQSDKLLRYLVKHSLDNRDELLRERVIGVDVFGREPGYDTNEESIVRVRANELRKRLAKYYQELQAQPSVRFTIPAGSYRVEFEPRTEVPTPPAKQARSEAAIDHFWRPAIASPRPVVICSPHPVLYGFTHKFRERATGSSLSHIRSQTEPLELAPDCSLHWRDVVTIRDQYIGMGSAHAIAAITGLLAERRKPSTTRFGNDISFEDLRTSPAVLVGAFSNHWTLDMTSDWRFVFTEHGASPTIQDRATGQEWALSGLTPSGRTKEDYAIVARVFQSRTGELLITAAGITQYGTRTAGEFLVNPSLMERAMRDAVPDWPEKSIQVLLHAPVIGQIPGPPEVVAVHVW